MSGIYIMAAVTLTLSAALYGGLVYVVTGRSTRHLWLMLPGLPLSALVNLGFKRPLAIAVGQYTGLRPVISPDNPAWFLVFLTMLAPVSEEAIKVAPTVIRRIRDQAADMTSALWAGLALGVGFGLGEAIYLAYAIAQSPAYAGIPWYHFTGYLNERLLVTFAHGAMTSVVAVGLQKGSLVKGYLAAVGLHTLLNLGAVLFRLGLTTDWGASLTTFGATAVLALIFEWMRKKASQSMSGGASDREVIHYKRDV